MHHRDKKQNSFSISIFMMVNTIIDIVCHIFKHLIYEFNQIIRIQDCVICIEGYKNDPYDLTIFLVKTQC